MEEGAGATFFDPFSGVGLRREYLKLLFGHTQGGPLAPTDALVESGVASLKLITS